jgi:hypothetical protein
MRIRTVVAAAVAVTAPTLTVDGKTLIDKGALK